MRSKRSKAPEGLKQSLNQAWQPPLWLGHTLELGSHIANDLIDGVPLGNPMLKTGKRL